MQRLALILTLLLVPALALGQAQTTGRVTGTVVDEDGQAVVGALVTVESPALLGERQARTNERGDFLFGLLPVGPYRVVISAAGKKTMDFSFPLNLGQTVPLSVTMLAGQDLVEEVEVIGTQTRMETTANGENFNLDNTVEELPIQTRTIENIAFNAPNIAPGPNTTPSIAGAPAFDTVVLLDGAEISDPNFGGGPTLYIEDAVEEIQVLTSGISARYGRFQGGVLNAITKTGGNEFTASVRVEYTNDDWDSQTPFDQANNVSQEDDIAWKSLGTVGGYVMKDRLWFFLAGWYEPDSQTSGSVGPSGFVNSYTRSDEEERFQYKLRGAITSNHVVDANFLDYEASVANWEGLRAGDLDSLGIRSDPREVWTASYQGVLTDSIFLDAQWSDKEVSIIAGGDPARGIPYRDVINGFSYNNHWWDATDPSIRNNETFGTSLTYSFVTDSYGSHTLEGGFQTLESETGGENRQTSAGFNLIDATGAIFAGLDTSGESLFDLQNGGFYFLWQALELGGNAFINYDAFYLQDSWEIGAWRFDVGVRWEQYDNEGPLPVQTVDYDDISPRLGVTYNINNDWQVQASWGRYVARLSDAHVNNSTGVDSAPRIIWAGYQGPTLTGATGAEVDAAISNLDNWAAPILFTSPEFPTTVVDPGLSSPYAEDLNLSVKRALPNNTGTVTLTYTQRDFNDLVDDFTGGAYQNIVNIDTNGDGTLEPFDQEVWANNPSALREYDGLALTFDYRPNTTWNVGGNYTWSRTFGNYEGEATNQPGIGSALGDYPNSVPVTAAAPTGFLAGDTRHRIRAWGNYRFDFGRHGNLSLGGLFRYSSALPYSLAASVPIWNDDPAAANDVGRSYTHFFTSRGERRFNSTWALDLSANYRIQVWRDLTAWVKVSAVNALDRDDLISWNTSVFAVDSDGLLINSSNVGVPVGYVEGANFGQADSGADYQTPRTWLLTLGATWR